MAREEHKSHNASSTISDYLKFSNANTNGAYATSYRTNAVIDAARSAMADLFSSDPDEVVFGPNMTTLTFAVSRAMGRELKPGDEVLLTHLDHDANVSPWFALEEVGVKIQRSEIHENDCTLDMEDLAREDNLAHQAGRRRLRLKRRGYHQRCQGNKRTRLAHAKGALAYIDAVHYAPHGPIDVRALDCDFLVFTEAISFSGRTWAFCMGSASSCSGCGLISCAPTTDAVPFRWEVGNTQPRMHRWHHRIVDSTD